MNQVNSSDCHVDCGAEPPQTPANLFAAVDDADSLDAAAGKYGICSVDII